MADLQSIGRQAWDDVVNVRAWLHHQPSWLMVLDGCTQETLADLSPFLPYHKAHGGVVVVTSVPKAPGAASTLHLKGLDECKTICVRLHCRWPDRAPCPNQPRSLAVACFPASSAHLLALSAGLVDSERDSSDNHPGAEVPGLHSLASIAKGSPAALRAIGAAVKSEAAKADADKSKALSRVKAAIERAMSSQGVDAGLAATTVCMGKPC